ncbi:hypothetical protein SCT_3174 [Sulfuricella sp. T08]|uniref:hypothetical protein n=1 Tax=Sulfuricella sp. T08 TaxID=1632857 RepID=UPI0006179687|nr:hypothetical protein [Sulfuricella sp. T08]GAO37738.1 hypothetical protein SCT_3174 [Sulfuricella sp. T08]
MSEPAWLSYAGAITGTIGAITGIAGATMGYISYRRSGQMKALDLRLELRKAVNELRTAVQNLPSLLERAKNSHTAVASAIGHLGSGALQQWLSECEADLSAAKTLEAEVPDPSANYEHLAHSELETKLVAVHSLQSKATRLSEKYHAALAADDKEREQIRADVRVRTQAKL